MSQVPCAFPSECRSLAPGAWLERWSRKLVLGHLRDLREGRLGLVEGERRQSFGRGCGGPEALVEIRDARFFRALALGGTIGAAEGYMQGWWRCDDLPGLCRLMVANRDRMQRMEGGWAGLAAPARWLEHALRRNTRRGSRRNIAEHYDLGNDFFRLFLDSNLMYSCALFPRTDSSLEEASRFKVDRICRQLRLAPQDHLLEIGTGWGGFALHAAREYGCRVTTATISREQYEAARRRVRQADLSDRVEVILRDYRQLRGTYDKLVSIEMIEAVGHQYWDTFFDCCTRLLKPEGLMLLQAIVIAEREYERARRSVDFIKAYIFPGSCLPSVAALSRSLAGSTDMRLLHLEDIGPHYARTLRAWRERFAAAAQQVRQLGFSQEFIRMWDFYFCYCIGGFEECYISDVQMLLARPAYRQSRLPASTGPDRDQALPRTRRPLAGRKRTPRATATRREEA